MEGLEQFKNRVYPFAFNSIYLDEEGQFHTGGSLPDKVDGDGHMLPYTGNTVIFLLNQGQEEERRCLIRMQDALYGACPDMLAARLTEDTFHMTLHDLKSGPPGRVSEAETQAAAGKAQELLSAVTEEPWEIRMQAVCVFNMVNTSVVLGLEPCTEEDCRRLMGLYEAFEEICPLRYPMTPHITLAYYRPGVCSGEEMKRLEAVFRKLREEKPVFTFRQADLVYAEFDDMNHYRQEGFVYKRGQ